MTPIEISRAMQVDAWGPLAGRTYHNESVALAVYFLT